MSYIKTVVLHMKNKSTVVESAINTQRTLFASLRQASAKRGVEAAGCVKGSGGECRVE